MEHENLNEKPRYRITCIECIKDMDILKPRESFEKKIILSYLNLTLTDFQNPRKYFRQDKGSFLTRKQSRNERLTGLR